VANSAPAGLFYHSAEVKKMSEAVLVLDMTNDSIAPGARALELRKQILGRTATFLAWARGSGRPVVHICSARRKTDKWFLKYWEFVNQIWTPGQQPIPELFDREKDTIVHKRRYSGFFGSDLDITLRELGIDSLVLIGWSTSLAVLTTAIDAWQLGYPTTVLSDLTIAHAWGGHSVEENQQWSLDLIKAFAFSRIATSDALMG
jgi:nicotinamidase-related amidase